MISKLWIALKAILGKTDPADQKSTDFKTDAPEVAGLRLSGAIEIDPLMLKLIEPDLTIEGAASTQLIQAVGVVDLDGGSTRLVRYYTDDDAYIQVLQEGTDEAGIIEISLWYFYDTKPIDSQERWDRLLKSDVVTESGKYDLDDTEFEAHWDNTAPVCMTETTYPLNGQQSSTDQFAMLYSRKVSDKMTEELLVAGEEKEIGNNLDRSVVRTTGIQLNISDFKVVA